MGLFGKKSGATGQPGSTTVIAAGALVTGEIALNSNIHVDGKIEGVVRTDAKVTISPSGKVSGTLYADKAIINGEFDGEIYAKSIDILSNGHLKGDITCSDFTVQKGGIFLGTSKKVSSEEVVNLSSGKSARKTEKSTEPEIKEKKA